MSDKTKQSKGQDEFVDEEDPGTDVPAEEPSTDGPDVELKKLRAENKRLKKQLEEAQQRISELEASQSAAERRIKAEKILKKWESKGRTFVKDEERDAELERLAGLTEDALSATEAVIDSLAAPKKEGVEVDPVRKPEAAASRKLKADAGVDPLVVDDKKPASLEEKLKSGFMAAYKSQTNQEVA